MKISINLVETVRFEKTVELEVTKEQFAKFMLMQTWEIECETGEYVFDASNIVEVIQFHNIERL